MKKSDLKDGDVVEYLDGQLRMVFLQEQRLRGFNGGNTLDATKDNLKHEYYHEMGIVKVWRCNGNHLLDIRNLDKPFWTREPVIKITVGGNEITLSKKNIDSIRAALAGCMNLED